MDTPVDSIEAIVFALEQLVARRQALRAAHAEPALLEGNRLDIARLQRQLSDALITKYSRAAA